MPFAYVTVLPVNIIFRSTGRSNMGSISSYDQPLLTDKDLINTSSGIFPRTLTNVRFLEKIEFYKRKSVCKAIVFAALGLGESPGGLSGGKDPNCFGFSMSLRPLNKQWH